MVEKQFGKDEVIFRQGETGNTFYKITDGTVGIIDQYGEEGALKLAELTSGQYFGELAVIEAFPRSATAVSLSDGTKVQEFTTEELNGYLKENPDAVVDIMQYIGSRVRDLTLSYAEVSDLLGTLKADPSRKDDEAVSKKVSFFSRIFKGAPKAAPSGDLEEKDAAHAQGPDKNVHTVNAGEVIFKEGEIGSSMYDIHGGRVGIYSGYQTPEQVELTVLYPNTFFGEIGMLSGEARSATAVALDDNTVVETISKEDLKDLYTENPMKVDLIVRHLSNRLRRLSQDYISACGLAAEVADSPAINAALASRLQEYTAKLYD